MSSRQIYDIPYKEWTDQSRTKLKKKISDNYNHRLIACTKTINKSLQKNFPKSNVSVFKIPESTMNAALAKLYHEVDTWPGVDLSTVRQTKKKLSEWKFEDYFQRADNWWNRYKSIWIGDHLFYPLFHTEIAMFIKYNGCEYCAQAGSADIKNLDQELLIYVLIRDIMNAEIKFERAKKLPLILDQSYTKSELLQRLFKRIGDKYDIQFAMPSLTSV